MKALEKYMGRFGEIQSRVCIAMSNVQCACYTGKLEQNLSLRKEAEADASFSPWDLLRY